MDELTPDVYYKYCSYKTKNFSLYESETINDQSRSQAV